MGSTLTNTQPKDTYKSLLKTSDSTELSGTAKYVSDGNGNDSPLALSTSAVGIGTSSPTLGKLEVVGGVTNSIATISAAFQGLSNSVTLGDDGTNAVIGVGNSGTDLIILKRVAGVYSESVRFPSTGGLTLNGGTSPLDDYEEGTWTPQVYYQNATDQANATNVTQVGTYTKIGRQVTLCGVLEWTVTGSPAVDNIGIKNLPFTSLNAANYFAFGVLQLHNADSYPSASLVLDLGFNSTVAAFITVTGASNQGQNIGATGTKLARFEITYFV